MTPTKPKTKQRSASDTVRLAEIDITNYKSLDRLALKLPPPSTPDELDAFVLGSKNGVGKTSLLECCALSILGAGFPELLLRDPRPHERVIRPDLLIRSGSEKASTVTQLTVNGKNVEVRFDLSPSGFKPNNHGNPLAHLGRGVLVYYGLFDEEEMLNSLFGRSSEPLIFPPILMFHSYRKVLEGSSALGAMVDPSIARRAYLGRRYNGSGTLSTFKVVLVQALMAKSGLFEGTLSKGDHSSTLEKLNGLIRDFAGGIVEQLRPGPDGTLELRVKPVSGGESFSFDGLSSGQKEIIATLFLIWFTTRDQPSIVLIDEPELHLNAEWQRLFVHKIRELAPKNQYILATHSEEIYGSVPEQRRLMLRQD